MKSSKPWIRQSQRVIRMVSELHRMGYQRLRVFPYEYPLAWRLAVAPCSMCSTRNGAYVPDSWPERGIDLPTYSSASEAAYFNWLDAKANDARALAAKFVVRFPQVAGMGQGRDWAYAGWLAELVGVLEQGDLLPFVLAEYFDPEPLELDGLPIRDYGTGRVLLEFPLPPPGEVG